MVFKQVYFRHNKKLMLLINGFQNGSTGTIYIPTNQELHICNEDILVEGMPNVSVKNVDTKLLIILIILK